MKRNLLFVLYVFIIFGVLRCSKFSKESADVKTKITLETTEKLKNEGFKGVTANFDDQMKAAVNPVQLETVWKMTTAKTGDLQSIGETREQILSPNHIIYMNYNFEKKA
ncbi:MAG: DUF3887 domain-containing protein [Armatimonadota bacterium]